ncbi:MAG: tetratricopeptide repeat protein [Acidobacteriota bacterium]
MRLRGSASRYPGLLALPCVVAIACGHHPAPPRYVEVPELDRVDQLDAESREEYQRRRMALKDALARNASAQETCQVFGALGTWFLAYQNLDGAEAALQNAVTACPAEVRWHYYLGHVRRTKKDVKGAAKELQAVVDVNPGDVAATCWLAELRRTDGELDDAEQLFQRALARDGRCVFALLGLGKVALARHDAPLAIERLEAALRMQPGASEIAYQLGLAYRASGDLARAEPLLAKGQGKASDRSSVALDDPLLRELESLRKDQRYYTTKGLKALRAERIDEAIELLRKAVDASDGRIASRLNLARALMMKGDADAAIAELDRALQSEPNNAAALFSMGVAKNMKGEMSAAEAQFREALAVDPGYAEAHQNLANILLQTGRSDEASVHFARTVELEPGNEDARYGRALALIIAGRIEEVRALLEDDVKAMPQSANLKTVLSRVLSTSDLGTEPDRRRALELAQDAYARHAGLAEAESVAMALARLREFGKAVDWQQACANAVNADASQFPLPWVEQRMTSYRKHVSPGRVFADSERPTRILVAPPGS